MPASHHTVVTGYTAAGTALLVAFFHPETSTASAGESRSCSSDRHGPSSLLCSHFSESRGSTRSCLFYMDDFAGSMEPRPPHIDGPPYAERVPAWTLIIDSGHIPLRTRLGTCSRALYRPLRWRHLMWTQRIIFQDLHNVWTLLQANRE